MNNNLIWIYVLTLPLVFVTSHPVQDAANTETPSRMYSTYSGSNNENFTKHVDEKVISVRITSSVAIERGNGKLVQRTTDQNEPKYHLSSTMATAETFETNDDLNDLPSKLRGANIEFIKQLNAKKEPKLLNKEIGDNYQSSSINQKYEPNSYGRIAETDNGEPRHTYVKNIPSAGQILLSDEFVDFKSKSTSVLDAALKLAGERLNPNNTKDDMFVESTTEPVTEDAYPTTSLDDDEFSNHDKDSFTHLEYSKVSKEVDSVAEPSIESILEIANKHSEDYENIENVPLARSLVHSPSSKNYIQGLNNKPPNERESSTRLTTVSFNILHDATKMTNYENPTKLYRDDSQLFQGQQKFYNNPTIYSRPAQVYSEPAKFYSEPAKIYSEPAKIYSEPAKVYSEPAKIYGEPAKFYSEPASLHLKPESATDYVPWLHPQPPAPSSSTTPVSAPDWSNTRQAAQQERNYEVDEKDSVLTDGRSHGVQESTTEKCKQDNCKVGYVVKGRTFNKYRVEERTADGFIVGEYGVVRNEDGALRGVRYTADGDASPRLIYDTLMKFLQLK